MGKRQRLPLVIPLLLLVALPFALPEWPRIPVAGASPADWNPKSFWYEPWGVSGVHKGIDIFARRGQPALAPTYGIVVFAGELPLGGRAVAVLGPKLRIHYLAHLDSIRVRAGTPVRGGALLGTVGDSGNAKGKPPHLHYAVLTPLPYPWRADRSTQGWKKMFYLDPLAVLGVH